MAGWDGHVGAVVAAAREPPPPANFEKEFRKGHNPGVDMPGAQWGRLASRPYAAPLRYRTPQKCCDMISPMQEHIDNFMQHLKYERNLSEHTLRNYESDLLQFYNHVAPPDKDGNRRQLDVRDIDNLTIREFMAVLYERRKKKSSIHRKIATLRTFFRFLCREGLLEINPARLVASPRVERKLPNHLSIQEMIAFIETPESDTVLGKRDRAILELLYASGVRVSELVNLNLRDIDFVNQTVRVKGKGRKERIVPFGDHASCGPRDLPRRAGRIACRGGP